MKIAAVTGGRADWGLLSMPLTALRAHRGFDVSVIVTGQHLMPAEHDSLAQIRADGFADYLPVDIGLGDDSPRGIADATGRAVEGLARVLSELLPDLLLILGDRYEILAAAISALPARIPVAHLCGGDITEGAMDDAIRHAITKLSHIHFVTNAVAAGLVRQLGEDPRNIHCVGSPGLDKIAATPLLAREDFFASVGLSPRAQNLLITYHPATLADDTLAECEAMLHALDDLRDGFGLIFTGANADTHGRSVDAQIARFVRTHGNAVSHRSLGSQRYFSALSHVDAMVGNSSSGIYEAPSFKRAVVNIGDRQKGRLRAGCVIDVAGDRQAIRAAIHAAVRMDCTGVTNPYGNGTASQQIVDVLADLDRPRDLIVKRFVHHVG